MAWARSRAHVERLEDRVLLSAEPMIQQSRPEAEEPLAAANVVIEVGDRTSDLPTIADISQGAIRVDLTRGATQSNQLQSGGGKVLELNSAPTNLLIDLGAGDDEVLLSQQPDGRLKLSGSSELYELIFAKPTGALGIRGLDGVDKVTFDSLSLDTAALLVESESILLPAGKTLQVGGNVLLKAQQLLEADELEDDTVALNTSVIIDGTVRSGGAVMLESVVGAQVGLESTGVIANLDIEASTSAIARVGGSALIEARSLEVVAITENLFTVEGEGGFGTVDITSIQTTSAVVAGGARLIVDAEDDSEGIDVLIEAVDRSRYAAILDTAGSLVSAFTGGFDLGISRIEIVRNTQASLGDGGFEVSLAPPKDGNAPSVQVSAASLDAPGDDSEEEPTAGINGSVESNLVGVQTIDIIDNVLAMVAGADIDASALGIYALTSSSASSRGKVAKLNAEGTTEVRLSEVTITAPGAVAMVARDDSVYSAESAGFSAELPLVKSIQIGVAVASATVDRGVLAQVSDAEVEAGDFAVIASSEGSMSAVTESLAVVGDEEEASETFSLSLGGTIAWTQLTGAVEAIVESSTISAGDEGNIVVEALNATEIESSTSAGSTVTNAPGAAGGISLAFNAVGWDMGNIALAGINALLGTDLLTDELPLETTALVMGTDLSAGGDISVRAVDAIALTAEVSNESEANAGAAAASSVGASGILASNRVRAETRALIRGHNDDDAGLVAIEAGGSISVEAEDESAIEADVTMTAAASSGGGAAMAVGGIVVRNDMRAGVLASVTDAALDAGVDVTIGGTSDASITASLSGEVSAGSESEFEEEGAEGEAAADDPAADSGTATDTGTGADTGTDTGTDAGSGEDTTSGGAAGGGALSVNALIATNLVLNTATAELLDSEVTILGSLGVEAENVSTIEASNAATTESTGGVAAGVTLAFNTIGWESQNILFAAIDALLGTSIGDEAPAEVRAEIARTVIEVGEDLTLSAVSEPQITADIENSVASEGGASASFVLASNMLSSRASALLTDLPGVDPHTAGSLTVEASDTAGVASRVSLSAEAAGGASLGGLVARNDLRSAVTTLVEQANLEIDGDVSITGDGSATLTALITDQPLEEQEEEEAEEGGAADEEAAADGGTAGEGGDAAGDGSAAEDEAPAGGGTTGVEEKEDASFAFNGIIATNLVLAEVNTSILDSTITAAGDLEVAGSNASSIEAENAAAAEAGGTAIGVTLAFNTIGWEAQNVLFATVDALLGTDIGDEQPAGVVTTIRSADLSAEGAISISAETEESVAANIERTTASSGASTAAGFVLASNMIASRAATRISPENAASPRVQLVAGEGIEVSAADTASIQAQVCMVTESGGAVAVGGLVARNDLRSSADAELDRVDAISGGELTVMALEGASIEACLSGETHSAAAEEEAPAEEATEPEEVPAEGDAGAATDGATADTGASDAAADTGTDAGADTTAGGDSPTDLAPEPPAPPSLAVNALISTNMVLSRANAVISNSDLLVEGDLTVGADNVSTIEANNFAAMSSDGTAVGVTLAFNTIGWEAQNVLFNSLDALLGTSIGDEQPALISARVVNTGFAVAGDVKVQAGALDEEPGADQGAHITATISNEAAANADGAAASFVLASNKVSTRTLAWVSPILTGPGEADSSARAISDRVSALIGGSIEVAANDSAVIDAEVSLEATSGGGAALGGVAARNDVRGDVDAGIDRMNIDAGGDVSVFALELAQINSALSGTCETLSEEEAEEAEDPVAELAGAGEDTAAGGEAGGGASGGGAGTAASGSGTSGSGTSSSATDSAAAGDAGTGVTDEGGPAATIPIAVNGAIATNLVLSSARATITRSEVIAGGDLTVEAENESGISAENEASITSGGTAVGVTLAYNTIGWEAQDLFTQTIDALLGTSIGDENPAEVLAAIDQVVLDIGGDMSVSGTMTATLEATISNEAVSEGSGSAASVVLASNAVSTKADAYVRQVATPSDRAFFRIDHESREATQDIEPGTQVVVSSGHLDGGDAGKVYRYLGEAGEVDLAEEDYSDTDRWQALDSRSVVVGGELSIEASDAPSITADITVIATATTPDEESDGEYFRVDHKSGNGLTEIAFGEQVLLDDDHEAGGEPGRIYRYMGPDDEIDLAETDYTNTGYWYELIPLPGMLDQIKQLNALLDTEMPYLEREVSLFSIPIGGKNYDVGFKVGAGWKDLRVVEFLKGIEEDDATDWKVAERELGVHFEVPSIPLGDMLFAAPELNIDLILPDPRLPLFEFDMPMGVVEHGGQEYEWGLALRAGWLNTTLTELIDLKALVLEGEFIPEMPVFEPEVYFRPVDHAGECPCDLFSEEEGEDAEEDGPSLETLQILPSQFIIAAPSVSFTLLGRQVELIFDDITIDTPELFESFVNPDLDPLLVDLEALTAGFELPFGLDGFGSSTEAETETGEGAGDGTDTAEGAATET
ncbi:MAG: LEPR-XLL domain-containing protein, partial [Betaproteobacteria bacterium]|nr:LEPR-XLL domain-containing protein [Betaproteobacteria bacterium]